MPLNQQKVNKYLQSDSFKNLPAPYRTQIYDAIQAETNQPIPKPTYWEALTNPVGSGGVPMGNTVEERLAAAPLQVGGQAIKLLASPFTDPIGFAKGMGAFASAVGSGNPYAQGDVIVRPVMQNYIQAKSQEIPYTQGQKGGQTLALENLGGEALGTWLGGRAGSSIIGKLATPTPVEPFEITGERLGSAVKPAGVTPEQATTFEKDVMEYMPELARKVGELPSSGPAARLMARLRGQPKPLGATHVLERAAAESSDQFAQVEKGILARRLPDGRTIGDIQVNPADLSDRVVNYSNPETGETVGRNITLAKAREWLTIANDEAEMLYEGGDTIRAKAAKGVADQFREILNRDVGRASGIGEERMGQIRKAQGGTRSIAQAMKQRRTGGQRAEFAPRASKRGIPTSATGAATQAGETLWEKIRGGREAIANRQVAKAYEPARQSILTEQRGDALMDWMRSKPQSVTGYVESPPPTPYTPAQPVPGAGVQPRAVAPSAPTGPSTLKMPTWQEMLQRSEGMAPEDDIAAMYRERAWQGLEKRALESESTKPASTQTRARRGGTTDLRGKIDVAKRELDAARRQVNDAQGAAAKEAARHRMEQAKAEYERLTKAAGQ